MNKNSKIFVAGATGLVGGAIVRKLLDEGFTNVIGSYHSKDPSSIYSSHFTPHTLRFTKIDLTRQRDTEEFFEKERPEYVFLAAAKVGGIMANIKYPADFFYDNMLIQCNVIYSAYKYKVKKLLFISSSCSYPRLCPQPMKETYLLNGKLEPTNEFYAIAKIAGMKMIEAFFRQYGVSFFSLIFPNIYGPNDNFDLKTSHVIPALIRKIYEAKINKLPKVEIWGTGRARREFLYVDDVADACIFFMNQVKGGEILNVGAGRDISINELATIIKEAVSYNGELVFDMSKPDGMPQKLLDISKTAQYGWTPKISLKEGIQRTLEWFIQNVENKVQT